MPRSMSRQAVLVAVASVALAPLTGCSGLDDTDDAAAPSPEATESAGTSGPSDTASSDTAQSDIARSEFARLEEQFDARLGVYALDTGTGEFMEYRADERFAYCSTFKVLAFGAVLQQTPVEGLDRVITYTEEDLVNYAPITEQHVDTGMSLLDIGEAALSYSDNTAANLLLEELGGPPALDEALEEIGDDVINVVRTEPGLSEAVPGDDRDTSTPRAMATSLEAFTLGDALPEDKRQIIIDMMIGNTTGDDLIRAGVPDNWEVGDKTGSGGYGTRNDIAVLWPPEGDPIVLAVMSSRDQAGAESDDALIAEAAEVVVQTLP
jgi:beta-lactamase class A